MKRWWIYVKERFPPFTYLILTLGISLSGAAITKPPISPFSIALSTIGFFLFFGNLRLMDERKDFEKDRLAHPERPLPRGLLSLSEVDRMLGALLGVMIAFGVLIYFFGGPNVSILYLFITFYRFQWTNSHFRKYC